MREYVAYAARSSADVDLESDGFSMESPDLPTSDDDARKRKTPAVRGRPSREPAPPDARGPGGALCDTFDFGQYQGERFDTVTEHYTLYYFWGVSQRDRPKGRGHQGISRNLAEYLEWVEEYFHVDHQKKRLTSKQTEIEYQADVELVPKTKKKPSKIQAAKEKWKDVEPCQPECDPAACSGAGSNHIWKRSTCLVCGTVTKLPATTMHATTDPDTCRHERTDFRGSSKTTHRVFCLDCTKYVAEMPQSEYKLHKRTMQQAGVRGTQLFVDPHEERKKSMISRELANIVADRFPAIARLHLKKLPKGDIEVGALVEILFDTVDMAIDEDRARKEARAFIPEARMHVVFLSLIHISEPTRPY